MTLYLDAGGTLSTTRAEGRRRGFDEYVSDPEPAGAVHRLRRRRHDLGLHDRGPALRGQRTDVLIYRPSRSIGTSSIAGPIKVQPQGLVITGTDSDFVVKVIDVYPNDYPTPAPPPGQPVPANAVRWAATSSWCAASRSAGSSGNSFEKPEPLKPGEPAPIDFELPDVVPRVPHGHRIMVQVQSSWFPLVDRNPQKFMEIPQAAAGGLPEGDAACLPNVIRTLMVEARTLNASG